MSLFIAIIVGAVVGVTVGLLMQGSIAGVLPNALIGVLGSIIGLAIDLVMEVDNDTLLFSWRATISEIIAAGLAVALFVLLQRQSPKKENLKMSEEE